MHTPEPLPIDIGQQWLTRDGGIATVVRPMYDNDETLIRGHFSWKASFAHERAPERTTFGYVTASGRFLDDNSTNPHDFVELLTDLPSAPRTDAFERIVHEAEGIAERMRVLPAGEPGLAINPKDAIGASKLPLHLWPAEATALGCLGMLEGMLKYGRNNYIAGNGVIASIYVDAAIRHLLAWFAGEENAHDTGTPHLANALATIAIAVKARAHGRLIDDRDFATLPNGARYRAFVEELTPHVGRLKEMFAEKNPKHFTIEDLKAAA